MRLLHRLARLDMAQVDLPFERPGQEMTAGRFRAVAGRHHRHARPAAGDSLRQAGFRPEVACNYQYHGSDLGDADDIETDIRTEQDKVPPDQRAVGNQGNYAFS